MTFSCVFLASQFLDPEIDLRYKQRLHVYTNTRAVIGESNFVIMSRHNLTKQFFSYLEIRRIIFKTR